MAEETVDLATILGPTLIRSGQNRERVPTTSIVGQETVIGLYFSAHWYTPLILHHHAAYFRALGFVQLHSAFEGLTLGLLRDSWAK
jgi:hypothetical protein